MSDITFKCYVTLFSWKFDPHPPPRYANNVEQYTIVTLFSGKADTPHPLLRYVTLEWPHILKLLPSICAYLRQLKGAEDEHSEYIRIASVREWIISKTSLDASKSSEKLWLGNCRTGVSQRYFRALRRVVDKLPK